MFQRSAALTLATLVAFLGLSIATTGEARAFDNGSFETGDLSGWETVQGDFVTVTTFQAGISGSPDWTATDGAFFARLAAGAGEDVFAELYQTFYANSGSVVEFDAFFDAGDYDPFNDDAYVVLTNLVTGEETTLYFEAVSTVGDYGHADWTTVTHTITEPGPYQLWAGVRNVGDNLQASHMGLDNVSQSDPLLAPNAPFNPSPADGAMSVLPSPDLEVDVTHPQGLPMNVTFFAGDGTELGTDTDVASGGTAVLSTAGLGFGSDTATSYTWYAVAEAGTLTATSDTWTFGTWIPISAADLDIVDSTDDHAFTVTAVAESAEGEGAIGACELVVTDGDGNAQVYTATPDTSFGDGTQALCDFGEVRYDDNGAWDPIDVVESGVTVAVRVTDTAGYTDSISTSHNFPNHPPLIVEELEFADIGGANGFEAWIVAVDTDGGPAELGDGECIFEHRLEGDSDWTMESTSPIAPYAGDDDLARCELSIFAEVEPGGTAGYEPGDVIEVRVTVADRYGATATSDIDSHPIPFLDADHIVLEASPTSQTVGEEVTITAQVVDASGSALAREVDITLSVSGSAYFLPDELSTIEFTTSATTGAGEVILSDTVAEVVTVSVSEATQDGDALPADEPHGEATVEFVAGPAHHVSVSAPDEATAGDTTEVVVQVVDEYGNPTEGSVSVCLSTEGNDGTVVIEEGDLVDPEDIEGVICGETDASGYASFDITATRAEEFTIVVESSGLPGSATDDETTDIVIVPAGPDHLRFTVIDEEVLACGEAVVEAQLVDEFDNPITDLEETDIEVTLTASAPSGAPLIVDTTLEDAAFAGDDTVTGTLPDGGMITVTVSLDAAEVLELSWTSDDLAADPTTVPSAFVDFELGPVDPAASELTASGTQVFAFTGSVDIEIVPRDACGLALGEGQDVELTTTFGNLTDVVDEGDGTYTAQFSTDAGECPEDPAVIDATVNGELLDDWLEISSICAELDPGSPVTVVPGDEVIEACAADGVFAAIEVIPTSPEGVPMPPDQDVTVTTDDPFVVSGGVDSETDADGVTVYTVWVGSNRCSDTAYELEIQVGGVTLDQTATVEFTCPPVVAGGVDFEASPTELPADGESFSEILLTVTDSCGNPAFGRTVDLTVFGEATASLSTDQVITADALGQPEDGTATVEMVGHTPGPAGLRATVGNITQESDPELVIFTLPDALLSLNYFTDDGPEVFEGDVVTLIAELTNVYDEDLTDLVLTHDLNGLEIVEADGVDSGEGTVHYVDRLGAGETITVAFDAIVVGEEFASAQVTVEYGAEQTDDRHEVVSQVLEFQVSPVVDDILSGGGVADGCGCGATNGGSPDWAILLLTALGFVAIRRIRRRSGGEAAA